MLKGILHSQLLYLETTVILGTYQVPGKNAGVGARVECVGGHGFALGGVDGLDEGGHGVRGVVHVDAGRDRVQADRVQLARGKGRLKENSEIAIQLEQNYRVSHLLEDLWLGCLQFGKFCEPALWCPTDWETL